MCFRWKWTILHFAKSIFSRQMTSCNVLVFYQIVINYFILASIVTTFKFKTSSSVFLLALQIECIPTVLSCILGNITAHKASWLLSSFFSNQFWKQWFRHKCMKSKRLHYYGEYRSFLRINDGGEWQKFRYSTSMALNSSIRPKALNFSWDFQKSQSQK